MTEQRKTQSSQTTKSQRLDYKTIAQHIFNDTLKAMSTDLMISEIKSIRLKQNYNNQPINLRN